MYYISGTGLVTGYSGEQNRPELQRYLFQCSGGTGPNPQYNNKYKSTHCVMSEMVPGTRREYIGVLTRLGGVRKGVLRDVTQ